MTPLTTDPTVVILIDDHGDVIKTATNVAPDLKVQYTKSQREFARLSCNRPFHHDSTEVDLNSFWNYREDAIRYKPNPLVSSKT